MHFKNFNGKIREKLYIGREMEAIERSLNHQTIDGYHSGWHFEFPPEKISPILI